MKIQITKATPYRRNIEREIKIGEIHEVKRVRQKNSLQSKAYFFEVDNRERMALYSDCVLLK